MLWLLSITEHFITHFGIFFGQLLFKILDQELLLPIKVMEQLNQILIQFFHKRHLKLSIIGGVLKWLKDWLRNVRVLWSLISLLLLVSSLDNRCLRLILFHLNTLIKLTPIRFPNQLKVNQLYQNRVTNLEN